MAKKPKVLDLSEKLHFTIDGNLIPSMLCQLCKIEACPSLKDSLIPLQVMGLAEGIISKTIETIVQLWNQDNGFRQIVVCQLIANSQLDTLCDTRKYMN